MGAYHQSSMNYRPDIDGLRAIAVLAVALYHYGIGPVHGGFVGVDIFFVISGYLITGIIHKELGRGDFTFAGFYERRVRRIFPALFAMLLATLGVGAWLLLPSDLVNLGNATLATLLFGSNVLFWRQSGYFDRSSEYNALLHTWSLAVEEQFYIGLPALLMLLHRCAKAWLKSALIGSAIVSFALCISIQEYRPSATFFLSPFRAWELLLGGVLAIGAIPAIHNGSLRWVVSAAALTSLLWSLWWIKPGPTFPGWQAALPVLATAALLHAGEHGNSPIQRLLSLKPVVFIGLISYSLYLWHWPLLVFVRYRTGMELLSPTTGWVLLAVGILLATASYRWVETPFRRRNDHVTLRTRRAVFSTAVAVGVLAFIVALVARLDGGWQSRFATEIVALDVARRPVIPFRVCDKPAPDFDSSGCRIGVAGAPPRVLLWGDSHALAWAPAVDEMLRLLGVGGVVAIRSACPPLVNVSNPGSFYCKSFNDLVANRLAGTPVDHAILVSSWLSYTEPEGQYSLVDDQGNDGNLAVFPSALHRTIDALRPHAKRIVIIGPTPGAPRDVAYRMAMAKLLDREFPEEIAAGDFRLRATWFWRSVNRYQHDEQIVIVDPATWFCDDLRCRYTTEVGGLLYRDGGHLSLVGARFVAAHFPFDVLARSDQQVPAIEPPRRHAPTGP